LNPITKRNLIILWVTNFIVAASAMMILPFLSLYIETFGNYTQEEVQRWAGFVFGITFLVAFFVSPLWGRFGDQHGRKKILIFSGSGIATCIFFMAFTTSVEQLFTLRFLNGLFTGFIPTTMALISAQTPKNIAGKVLGTLQTGTVSGALMGPVIGGWLSEQFGFEQTFILTALGIYIAVLIAGIGVKEINIQDEKMENKETYSRKEVLHYIFSHPTLFAVMIIALIAQFANLSIQPLLALYVNKLSDFSNSVLLAGLAFSITGLGNLFSARYWGKLGDRIGHEKTLLIVLILSTVFFIPQGFSTSIEQLIFLRFLFGIQLGGLIPCLTAAIRQSSPVSIQGEVQGYQVSSRFLGNVLGPMTGGILSGYIGISFVFFTSGILFLVGVIILWFAIQKEQKAYQQKHTA